MKSITKVPTSFLFLGQGLLLAALLACNARAGEAPPPNPSTPKEGSKMQTGDASTFIKEAMQGNNAEIALSELAERKSQNADVKKLAATLREDHQQANEKLQPIARSHGVAMDSTLDEKHQKKLDQFKQMNGSEFDKEYAKEMLRGHQKTIAMYEKAAQNISDPDVKHYAQTALPTLREHLQETKQTAQAVGVDSATISSILKESSGSMGGTGDDSEKESGSDSGSTPPTPPMPEEHP